MERAQENKSIFDLLKELADIQFNRAKVEAALFVKKGTKLVSSKVNDVRECILESAEEYHQRIEFIEGTKTIKNATEANILRNYELSLNVAKREYEAMRSGIAREKGNLETIENTAIMRQAKYGKLLEEEKKKPEFVKREELKKQAKEAIDNGDDDKAASLIDEIRVLNKSLKVGEYEKEYNENLLIRKRVEEQRAKWDKILDGLQEEERTAIEIMTGKKENLLKKTDEKYLAVIGKQNWFKKVIGRIANAFVASKRYADNVTDVLNRKVENLGEKLVPGVVRAVGEKRAELEKRHEELDKKLKAELVEEHVALASYLDGKGSKDTSRRSEKMYDITKEEEEMAKEESKGKTKGKAKAEPKKEVKKEPKEEVKEEVEEEIKEEPKEEIKEEVREEIKEEAKEENKIEFKQNERINPWKVVGMGRTVGWRGVGKGKKIKIDKRKAGRPVKDEDEKTNEDDEER